MPRGVYLPASEPPGGLSATLRLLAYRLAQADAESSTAMLLKFSRSSRDQRGRPGDPNRTKIEGKILGWRSRERTAARSIARVASFDIGVLH